MRDPTTLILKLRRPVRPAGERSLSTHTITKCLSNYDWLKIKCKVVIVC